MNVRGMSTEYDPSLVAGLAKNRKNEAGLAVASDSPPATARQADVLTISADTTPPTSYTKPRTVTPAAEPPPATGPSGAGDAPSAQPSPGAAQPSPITDGVTYGQAELDSLLASFGAGQGSAQFNAASDLNGDGLVNFDDLNRLLSNFAPAAPAATQAPPVSPAQTPIASAAAEPETASTATPSASASPSTPATSPTSTPEATAASAPLTPEAGQAQAAPSPTGQTDGGVFDQGDLPSLLFAYGSRLGESGFDQRFDFNSDGVIGFDDLNTALSSISPGAAQHATTLEGLVNAFGLGQGSEGFAPEFDFDGDGFIGFADLNRLLDDLFTQQQ